MKKTAILLISVVLFSATAAAQASNTENSASPRFVPGDLFYPVESFVEEIEVAIAGIVGGPDFKSKALANNADEALREAKVLRDNNRSEKASEMADRYSKLMNRSQSLVSNSRDQELKEKLNNISEKNVETLEKVKKRAPEEAEKGLENALNNSRRNGAKGNSADMNKSQKRGRSGIPESQSGQNFTENLGKGLNSSVEAPREPETLNNNTENPNSGDLGEENSSRETDTGHGESLSGDGKENNSSENPLTRTGRGLL